MKSNHNEEGIYYIINCVPFLKSGNEQDKNALLSTTFNQTTFNQKSQKENDDE